MSPAELARHLAHAARTGEAAGAAAAAEEAMARRPSLDMHAYLNGTVRQAVRQAGRQHLTYQLQLQRAGLRERYKRERQSRDGQRERGRGESR